MLERTIFMAALEKSTPEERSRYLEEACAGDATLRARVEALLQSHDQGGSFLGKPVPERVAAVLARPEGAAETQSEPPDLDNDSEELSFLTPTDKPGVLGRLGHYEVQEIIGRGGMGVVLRAFDEKLHRVVAIKVMAAQLATNATARRRFTREAQAHAAVSHDHVVTIHAVEEANGLPYLVMQYVSGVSLQERLDKSGPLQLAEIVRIGVQTAAGLAAAHAQGLIHRDIKPANILLENGVERVKITDFGLARAAADANLTQSGVVAGTPHYMSPEQARGEAVDQRTDLFSLGSVLYALCTGRVPFRASRSMAVLKRVCEEAPTPIHESNPDIPEWLSAIIDRLQAKEPAQRYQSAAEVAELLGRHLAHLQHPSTVGQVASLPQETQAGLKPARRRHIWAIAAAVLVCLLGGLSLTEATGVTKLRATVIRIFTPDGTLVVETNDPAVKVTVEGDGDLVITGAGAQELRLRPGSYKLRATKDGKPVRLDQELVTITRGDKQVVRVTVETKGLAEPVRPTFVTPWSDSDTWVVKGQELLQPDNSGCYRLFFGDPSWTDYDFEGEFEVIAGGNEIIFAFRATGPRTHLYATIGANGDRCDRHGILAQFNDKSGAVVLAGVTGPTTPKSRWYRVRVEARGNRFKLFLDGKLLTSASQEGFPRGCVGLVTNPSNARFRNLKVTDPSGKVLLEGLPAVLPKAKDVAYRERGAALQDAVRLKPDDAEAYFALGDFHAQWGEWNKAGAEYDRALELYPTDYDRWCQAAVLHLAAGDLDGYRRISRELVQRYSDTDDPLIAERVVNVSLMLPDALTADDFERAQKLAVRAVTGTEKHAWYRYWMRAKALADYRAGRYAQAVKWLEQSAPKANGNHDDALIFAILSMAQQGLGRTEEAQAALTKMKTIVAKMPDPARGQPLGDWRTWLIVRTVCREAESLLKKK